MGHIKIIASQRTDSSVFKSLLRPKVIFVSRELTVDKQAHW